ncbi:MAG: chemotaxis-specific protein-glutamate methyltransferase CheB [Syntrophobacterales bacterium]|jgi:two-component system chemotaxis response regulator CheB|nr:chemotaxis-specific protein-glutamate methyltransferase CheB [Syntrophobacterales bacterium]
MSSSRPIKVLVVEDSPVVRELITHILTGDPEIQVIGAAASGAEAIEAATRRQPDLITMDVNMPGINGYEATRQIMQTCPTPIIIVSAAYDPDNLTKTFEAIEAGALAVLPPPLGIGHPDFRARADELIRTVKLMAEIKLVRRWAKAPGAKPAAKLEVKKAPSGVEVVAIGASTGGPLALKQLLAGLGSGFPAPVLIVQHMSPGFIRGFAEWLGHASCFPVQVARPREQMLPGHAYVAPDDFHMGVDRAGGIELNPEEPENGVRPAVAYLFRSVAECYGPNAVGILLTGMGADGAAELALMKSRGALTIAQDKESSVVHGMPGQAIKLRAATCVLGPEKIADLLKTLVQKEDRNHNTV